MHNTLTDFYCVILAGGKGRRLWPCSREHLPKQFIDFFGVGRTQLQQAYDRFSRILPQSNIFINTNETYLDLVHQQLPHVSDDHIMAEPIYRNTAPSVAWANHRIAHINPEACLVVAPSDQTVLNEEVFKNDLLEALSFVRDNDCLLTMGVKPSRPEPGYGYVQILPAVLRNFDKDNPEWTISAEDAYMKENFPSYPNVSIDYSILEKSDHVYLKKCDFGWADMGTWHGIYEAMQKADDDNVVINSDVYLENSHNNIIKVPKDRFAVVSGLDGYIVAEEGNVLLICKKEDSSALIRKYVAEVQIKKGNDFI